MNKYVHLLLRAAFENHAAFHVHKRIMPDAAFP